LTVKDDDGAIGRKIKNVTVTKTSAAGVNVSAVRDEDPVENTVDLNWNGIKGEEVDIYMDGYLADFTDNDGRWTDKYFDGVKGTHRYKVCAYGSETKCSNEIKVELE